MRKIDVGQTINTLANVGVIAGIVFLAIELRQNQLLTEAMVAESYLAAAVGPGELIAANPQLAELLAKAAAGGDLTPAEDLQLGNLYAARLRGWQNAYLQYERGVLAEDLLRNYDETLRYMLTVNPDYLDYWEGIQDRYTQAFVTHVQNVISTTAAE